MLHYMLSGRDFSVAEGLLSGLVPAKEDPSLGRLKLRL